jgi:uncharacterized membrane protein
MGIAAMLGGGCSPESFVLIEPPAPFDGPGALLSVDFISSHGDVIMGSTGVLGSGDGRFETFRWTRAAGWQLLGYPGGFTTNKPLIVSTVSKVALDGEVVVGFVLGADPDNPAGAPAASDSMAFRWTEAGGLVGLSAPLDTAPAFVTMDLSADGSTVVGSTGGHAFRWTVDAGTQDLGTLPGHLQSRALAVSADGSTVVGASSPTALGATPVQDRSLLQDWSLFKWTAAGGVVPLPTPPTMVSCETRPGLLSADGATVFGSCSMGLGLPGGLFRWDSTGVHSLGPLPPFSIGEPRAMTREGAVLVGDIDAAQPGGLFGSFRWTAASGLTFSVGPSGTGYPSFTEEAIDADGSVVVGTQGGTPARWIDGADLQLLALPAAFVDGRLLSVSADGTIAAGQVTPAVPSNAPSDATPPPSAAVWDATSRVCLVADLFRSRTLDLRGIPLRDAWIAADGTSLAGTAALAGQRPGLWIAESPRFTCPPP